MSWGPGFVISIIAIVMFAGIMKEYLRGRREEQTRGEDEDWQEMVSRLRELEERVRVLERIVTDPRDSLKSEINRL